MTGTSNLRIAHGEITSRGQVLTERYATIPAHPMRGPGGRQQIRSSTSGNDTQRREYYAGATGKTADSLFLGMAQALQKKGVYRIRLRASDYALDYSGSALSAAQKMTMDPRRGTTVNASNQLTAWVDQSGVVGNFTEATNPPYLSRYDNRANHFANSRPGAASAPFTATRCTATADSAWNAATMRQDMSLVVEDGTAGATHVIELSSSSQLYAHSGLSYRIAAVVKNYSGNRGVRLRLYTTFTDASIYFDPVTGVIFSTSGSPLNISVLNLGSGAYRIAFELAATSTGQAAFQLLLTDGLRSTTTSYNGDSASGIYIGELQYCEAEADDKICYTDGAPAFRGHKGLPVVTFRGGQVLNSASTLATIFAAGAKVLYIAIRPESIVTTQEILCDNGGTLYFNLRQNSASLEARNNDGAIDTAAQTLTARTFYLIRIRHASSVLYISINSGSGWSAETSVASGSTSTMTQTLRLGAQNSAATTNPLFGSIGDIIALNAAATTAEQTALEAVLSARWLDADIYLNSSFDTATMIGPLAEDFAATFTESSSKRYFWLDFETCKLCDFWHVSPMFGKLFDFGRDPIYRPGTSAERSGMSARAEQASIDLVWEGITAAKKAEFDSLITEYADQDGFWLYDSGGILLDGDTARHVRFEQINWKITKLTDSQGLKLSATQLL